MTFIKCNFDWDQRAIIDEGYGQDDLYRMVMDGNLIAAPRVGNDYPATLQRVDDRFVMKGATGEHKLNAAFHATDAERLHAHWRGFKLNATAEAKRKAGF